MVFLILESQSLADHQQLVIAVHTYAVVAHTLQAAQTCQLESVMSGVSHI